MATVTHCCASCFGDRGLQKNIIPPLSICIGVCSYCTTEQTQLVRPFQLSEYFGLLIAIYEPDDDGRSLVDWFKEDWDLFNHPLMDTARAKELLAEVLDNGEIVRRNFSPSARYQNDRLNLWERLRSELMYENRYFPANALDAERLGNLLSYIQADDVPTEWFRARLQTTDHPFSVSSMGAPPKGVPSHGRANPAGIPYLYLGSTPETAVSEVRPNTGQLASVANFEIEPDLKIVDLRNPRRLVSPFVLNDEDEIGLLRSDIAFLERLGEELTRPVVPEVAPIEYVPSQFLCEFIKRCGYAGVLYRSSVSEGINLALFNPETAKPGNVSQYLIDHVRVQIQSV